MEKWIDKTAIVTGASAGIGDAIVRDFANFGIRVLALARRVEKLDALKEELKDAKGEVIALKCDVSDKASIDKAFKEIERKVGTVHILVNNAGVAIEKSILGDDDSVEDAIKDTVNTNFLGLTLVTRAAYKLMKKSGDHGLIINIGSIYGHSVPFSPYFNNVYHGTKHAVRALTESLRHELIKLNDPKTRICEICPGFVETEIFERGGWKASHQKKPEDFLKAIKIPTLKCADISQTVNFMLMLPYNVNITEMIVRPVGESF